MEQLGLTSPVGMDVIIDGDVPMVIELMPSVKHVQFMLLVLCRLLACLAHLR